MHNESSVFLAELDYIASRGLTAAWTLNTQYAYCARPPSPSTTQHQKCCLNQFGPAWRQTERPCPDACVKFPALTQTYQSIIENTKF